MVYEYINIFIYLNIFFASSKGQSMQYIKYRKFNLIFIAIQNYQNSIGINCYILKQICSLGEQLLMFSHRYSERNTKNVLVFHEKLSTAKETHKKSKWRSETHVFSLEKQHRSDLQLSERLASLGILGAQLRFPLKPPIHHITIILRDFRRALNWVPIMPSNVSLSDSECDIFQQDTFPTQFQIPNSILKIPTRESNCK